MSRITHSIAATLGLVLLLQWSSVVYAADPAPDFALLDAQGKRVTLADYSGKPLILHFWATWCPACKRVQPGLQALANEHTDAVSLLGISFAEDEGVKPEEVLRARGHRFKTLVGGDAVAKAYQVPGTPTTFFINGDGMIHAKSHISQADDPELRKLTEQIIAQ